MLEYLEPFNCVQTIIILVYKQIIDLELYISAFNCVQINELRHI